jgi:hypothetical protein
MAVDNPQVCLGQKVKFSVSVKNIGADGFGYVGLTTDCVGSYCNLNLTNTSYLETNQIQTVTIEWDIPTTATLNIPYNLKASSWGNCTINCDKYGNGCNKDGCCKPWTRQDNATRLNIFSITGCPSVNMAKVIFRV